MDKLIPARVPDFLTVTQFRQLVGVSRGLAYELIRTGEIGAMRLGRRRALRIPREELRSFLERRRELAPIEGENLRGDFRLLRRDEPAPPSSGEPTP